MEIKHLEILYKVEKDGVRYAICFDDSIHYKRNRFFYNDYPESGEWEEE